MAAAAFPHFRPRFTTAATLLGMLGLAGCQTGGYQDSVPPTSGVQPLKGLAQNVSVRRNAYGRQLGSFTTTGRFADLGPIEMRFIRAPAIKSVQPGVVILAHAGTTIAAVQYHNQLAMAFHPELCPDLRIHKRFAALCR